MLTWTTGSLAVSLLAPIGVARACLAAPVLGRTGAGTPGEVENTSVGVDSRLPLEGGGSGSCRSTVMRVCRGGTGDDGSAPTGDVAADGATARSTAGGGTGALATGEGRVASRGKGVATAADAGMLSTGMARATVCCASMSRGVDGAGTAAGAAGVAAAEWRDGVSPSSASDTMGVRCSGSNNDGSRGASAVSPPIARAASRSRKSLMARTVPDRPAGGAGSS